MLVIKRFYLLNPVSWSIMIFFNSIYKKASDINPVRTKVGVIKMPIKLLNPLLVSYDEKKNKKTSGNSETGNPRISCR